MTRIKAASLSRAKVSGQSQDGAFVSQGSVHGTGLVLFVSRVRA